MWLAVALATLAACVVVIVHATRREPVLASALDGLDPVMTGCAGKGAVDVGSAGVPFIRGTNGDAIGALHLVESSYCGTRWGRVALAPAAARRLRGATIVITATRPEDGHVATYDLDLRGGHVGYGDMLSATGYCVEVSARLRLRSGAEGPQTSTKCR